MQVQVTAGGMEIAQEADQVLQAATEPVDRPGHDHVELASGGVLHQSIECGTCIAALSARYAGVLVDLDNLPTALSGHGLELRCNSGWAGFFSGFMQISGSTCYFRDARRGLAIIFGRATDEADLPCCRRSNARERNQR